MIDHKYISQPISTIVSVLLSLRQSIESQTSSSSTEVELPTASSTRMSRAPSSTLPSSQITFSLPPPPPPPPHHHHHHHHFNQYHQSKQRPIHSSSPSTRESGQCMITSLLDTSDLPLSISPSQSLQLATPSLSSHGVYLREPISSSSSISSSSLSSSSSLLGYPLVVQPAHYDIPYRSDEPREVTQLRILPSSSSSSSSSSSQPQPGQMVECDKRRAGRRRKEGGGGGGSKVMTVGVSRAYPSSNQGQKNRSGFSEGLFSNHSSQCSSSQCSWLEKGEWGVEEGRERPCWSEITRGVLRECVHKQWITLDGLAMALVPSNPSGRHTSSDG